MKLVSRFKNLLVPAASKPHTILTGPFKGLRMNLSLQHQAQLYVGLFERETYPWLERLSKGVVTAIDIGAAYGEYTVYFLKKAGATKVFAFEPDQACSFALNENLKLNGLGPSERLELSTKFLGASVNDREISLDSLASSIRSPCFVKLDVDGGEEQVLNGARTFNNLPGIRWLIETHSEPLEVACDKILQGAGFHTRIIPNAWWRAVVPELRPTAHNRWLAAWKSNDLAPP
jgi:hypothetical protein